MTNISAVPGFRFMLRILEAIELHGLIKKSNSIKYQVVSIAT